MGQIESVVERVGKTTHETRDFTTEGLRTSSPSDTLAIPSHLRPTPGVSAPPPPNTDGPRSRPRSTTRPENVLLIYQEQAEIRPGTTRLRTRAERRSPDATSDRDRTAGRHDEWVPPERPGPRRHAPPTQPVGSMVPNPAYRPQVGDCSVLYGVAGKVPMEQLPLLQDITAFDIFERRQPCQQPPGLARSRGARMVAMDARRHPRPRPQDQRPAPHRRAASPPSSAFSTDRTKAAPPGPPWPTSPNSGG